MTGLVLNAHLGIAYLVALVALVLGWTQMGRRIMTAILGVQVLVGVVLAAFIRPPLLAIVHIVAALAAMAAYIVARRLGERADGRQGALAMSAIGFVLVLVTMYLGLRMAGRM